ncbi:MAG: hypothetical protein ACE37H_17465 [Phycisphaeraceae bacterium]
MSTTSDQNVVTRSLNTLLAVQLEGLAHSMLVALQAQKSFGPEIKQLAKRCEKHFLAITDGIITDDWPQLSGNTSDVDIYALTTVMLAATKAFLEPEQLELHKNMIGFHRES